MTTLRQYLAAEQPDPTEPASFYVPGATGWNDPELKMKRARVRRQAGEDQQFLTSWFGTEDEQ